MSDSSPVVVTAALSAVGFLAVVGGASMSEHVDDLIVRVMKMMQEQSVTNMREVALRTLRLLVSSTGKVIDPYYKHPDLLPLLLGMIRAEDSISTRLEAIRVVGTLGAVDPYRCSLMGEKESRDNRDDYFPVIDASVVTEDYYSTVAIRALLRILKDTSLSTNHRRVVECIIQIYRVLGLKVVHFLPEIIPPFLDLVRQFSDVAMRAWVIKSLSELVNCVKLHIRNYLDDIFALIKECWCKELITHIVHLILAIAKALKDEFRRYLPDLLPNILSIFSGSATNPDDNPIFIVLEGLQQFGRILEDYLYLVLPPVLRLIEDEDALPSLRCSAVQMIGRLSRCLNLSEYSSSVIHPICRVLVSERSPDSLKVDGIQVLSLMVHQLCSEFAIFTPTVNKVLRQIKLIDTSKLEELMNIVLTGAELPELDDETDGFAVGGIQGHDASIGTQDDGKLSVVVSAVFQACVVQPRMTKEDWGEWLRRFSLELLRQSPSKALRSCWGLGQNYPPLSRELFNASFLSFWTVLKNEEERKDIIESLKIVFGYFEQHPTDVLQTLLNVIEFTEHANLNLRDELERGSLGALSMHCKAHAKALRYKEMEFLENPSPEVIERLITINDMLQHHEAAAGILVHAQRHHAVQVKESWLERLQKWDEALEAYERKHEENPLNVEVLFGRMRCMQSLGEWENLFRLCFDSWKVLEPEKRKRMAPVGASCAWVLQEWDFLEDCVNVMPEEEGYLYQAVISTHNHDFVGAVKFIDLSRRTIDAELTAVLPESYFRAYPLLVKAQQLTELEEVIDFIRLPDSDTERASQYREMWDKRIKQVQRRYHYWQDLLNVRRLVVEPQRDVDMWLKFAKLCEIEGSSSLSFRQLRMLLGDNDFVRDPAMLLRACGLAEDTDDLHECFDFGEDSDRTVWVVVSCVEHLYNIGQHECALDLMKKVVVLAQDIDEHLAARCFLKAGKWDVSLHEKPSDEIVLRAMECFRQSTVQDPEWSKGWHSWATMNVEMVNRSIPQSLEELYADNTGNVLFGFDEVEKERISTYVQAAVKGFFKSILCGHSKGGTVQDTLRLLTLWFAFGETENVYEALEKGFGDVQVLVWLEVIPQIMARVHMQGRIHALILKLLRQVGDDHPQALIYPLTVASRSAIQSRRQAAEHVLNHIRQQEDLLVVHAAKVSNELIRVAVLWAEQWYEGLETASRLYFGEHDINGMLTCMQKLHDMLDETQTTDERNFVQIFGSDLQRTREWLQRFKRTRNEGDLSQAWDGYFNAYRRLQKEIVKISLLELQKVSSGLHLCLDLELGMPGMYDPLKKEVKKIKKFHPILHVIPSKQRPRKITLVASDDKDYMYLLKGREDLRQDERVMQIFGLVNTLLATARDTSNRNLLIDAMPVVPLREDAGLISWLSECDTFHGLIQEHRASSSIKMGLEHDHLVHLSADYDTLPPTHKVELFEEGLSGIMGDDLYRVLWLRSSSSEVWLERRTNYTRSLALMSMVGYVLGLGDRHPSNLMLNRYTGKVSHIDFGDCFEVAQQREKYPEKVPFRLTRMLVMAMEVSGIEGTYRSTCNAVMSVLRRHRDSLMAMLEAFVHDPLINWRLLESHELSPVALDGETKTVGEPLGPQDIPADKYRGMYSKSSSPTRGVSVSEGESQESHHGNINEKAVCVVQRIQDKLTGMDFVGSDALPVVDQVERLIQQATSPKNLCQCYVGWCPFW
jgi:serine/threonine-protein kinase mTOR